MCLVWWMCLLGVVQGKLEGPAEKFLFSAMPPSCQRDNWGMPHQSSKPVAQPQYHEKVIRQPCAAQLSASEKAMSVLLPNATVIFSTGTPEYDKFISQDWVPENRDLYGPTSTWGKKTFSFDAVAPGSMKAFQCSVAVDADSASNNGNNDNSRWEVTRIGPMITTGGYDWIQIGWDDVWSLSSILTEHPDGIYIMEQYMSPVFKNGSRICYPPIHIHHMHMGPCPYVRQRFDPIQCLLKNVSCFDPSRTFETHGDYTCPESDGGLDCRVESMPEGFAQLVTVPLGIEGELNDVRAPNSPELEWYWEVGARWIPHVVKNDITLKTTKVDYKPLSLHNFGGPGNYDINIQKSLLFTFNIPTRYDSIFWYTGRMPIGGDLRRMKIHSHNNMFEQSLVFAASPKELGMTPEAGWTVDSPHKAIHPESLGFGHVDDVVAYVLQHLASSQEMFDANPNDQQQRPQIVCQSHYLLEVLDYSVAYDRKCSTCCVPWSWESNQIFTVLAVNVHHKHPVGLQSPRIEDLPDYLPGHVGYWLFYDSQQKPPRSNWRYSMYNHDPDGYTTALEMTGYQKIAMIFNKHTSPNWNDWQSTPNSLLGMILFWLITNVMKGIFALLFLSYLAYKLLKLLPKLFRSDYKKNDDCFYSQLANAQNDELEMSLKGGNFADRRSLT